jgi:hypothetical protein
MAEQPERPRIDGPIIENIPAELKACYQWIVWRYEWRVNKQGVGKWTKVPYTPGTTSRAMPNKESTWRTFNAAWACYLERPDFFDGIGFMFKKNDPYVGGDRDHSLDLEGIPPTYAEVSPSGEGIKFIARASGHYSRHTVKGEIYSSGRFFTITGRVIPGYCTITNCQEAVDRFLASLGGQDRKNSAYNSNGSRAQLAAAVSAEEWAEGRRLLRDELSRLLARLRASTAPKTQLWYVLRGDFDGLQDQYPRAGAIRGDGSIDSSQIRAIFANGVRGRGFSFPQFVALFYHFYGADCFAKWGTNQGFREEAATLWAKARPARPGDSPQTIVPQGDLLERVYQVLQNYRAGISAIVMLDDVARDLGIHKGTASKAIKDLVAAHRITTRRYGSHGGLIVEFTGELISKNGVGHSNHQNEGSPSAEITEAKNEGEFISGIETTDTQAENAVSPSAKIVTDAPICELISAEQKPALGSTNMLNGVCEKEAPYIDRVLYKSDPVFLPGLGNSQKCSLDEAIYAAFEQLPKDRVSEKTGILTKWPQTNRRIVEYVQAEYPGRWKDKKALERCIETVRSRRKAAEFDALKKLKRETLEKKAASIARYKAKLEERAATDPMQDIREWAAKEANKLSGRIGRYGWELGRREQEDAARIAAEGYSPGEEQEMLKLVEKEYKPPAPTVSLPTAEGMVERLRRLKQERT